jgi:hypothetical protein
MLRRKSYLLLGLLLFGIMALPWEAPAATTDYTWNTGVLSGNWSAPDNWSPAGPPNSDSHTAWITHTGGNVQVYLDMGASVSRLQVDTLDSLTFNDGSTLNLPAFEGVNPTVYNYGTITLNSTGNGTWLRAYYSDATLTGTGSLVLGGNLENHLDAWGAQVINEAGHTIRGGGTFDAPVLNRGSILADNQILRTYGALTNEGGGHLTASGSGNVLDIRGTVSGGQLSAVSGGAIEIGGGGALTNTTLAAGTAYGKGGALKTGLTIAPGAQVALNNGDSLDLLEAPTITNNGTIALNSTGNGTWLTAKYNDATLTGTGSLVLGGNLENHLDAWGAQVINEAGHTIQGGGTINAPVLNRGSILADNQILRTIGALTNELGGTLTASGSGNVLDIRGLVSGGQLSAVSGGAIEIGGGGALTNTTLAAGTAYGKGGALKTGTTIALGAQVAVNNGDSLDLLEAPTITNNGTIALNSTGSGTWLIAKNSDATLTGTGSLVLGGNLENHLNAWGVQVINEAGHTIQGGGTIDAPVLNRGSILADNQTLRTIGAITNELGGTLTASGSGNILGIQGLVSGGQLSAVSGGAIEIRGGGALTNTTLAAGTAYGKGGALQTGTTIAPGAQVAVNDGDSLGLRETPTITNNGTIILNSTGNATWLTSFYTDATLTGTGSVVLGGNLENHLNAWGAGQFINEAGHTIQGGGTIDAPVLNRGSILADNQTLRTFGAITNEGGGALTASGSGNILGIQGLVSGGQLSAVSGGAIEIRGGGALTNTTLTAGTAYGKGGDLQTGTTIALGAQVAINDGDSLFLSETPTITNNGTITLNSTGSGTWLIAKYTDATLTGTGSVVLGGNLENHLSAWGAGRVINEAGHTIQGGGTIDAPLENRGSLVANNATLRLNGAVTGSGTVSVTDLGILQVLNNMQAGNFFLSNNSGLLVNDNLTVDLKGQFSFAQTDVAKWNWGSGTALMLSGGGTTSQALEVGGADTGPAGLPGDKNVNNYNFDLVKFILSGAGTYAYLTDAVDNGHRSSNEALYVDFLEVDPGTTLNLHGLHLYTYLDDAAYLVVAGDGYKFGGGIIIDSESTEVPICSTLLLLGSGLLALGLVGRSRLRSAKLITT